MTDFKQAFLEGSDKVVALRTEVERLRACTNEHAVSALGALQDATGSNNTENPWLGVTAAVALLRDENERLRREVETWGQIWNDAEMLAARVEALRDGTAQT